MLGGVDVGDRAPARHGGHAVAEQVAPGDQDPRRARPADQLVRRDEDGVLRVQTGLGGRSVGPRAVRRHLDVHVGRGRREVPEGERAVAVQEDRDRPGVREDPGHVRRRREAPDLQRPVGVAEQLGLQAGKVDPPVRVLGDRDDVGDRLPPGQLVAVVLVGADEHDGSLGGRDPACQVVALVELRRQAQPQHVDEAVDGAGRAGAHEEDDMRIGGPDGSRDDPPGLGPEARGLEAGPRGLGVRVRVERQDGVPQVLLDEVEAPSRGGVVGVRHPAHPERPAHGLVIADDRAANRLDQGGRVHREIVAPATCRWSSAPSTGSVPAA